MQWACASGIAAIGQVSLAGKSKRPNLLIIHTDEHNFRTLGCYRQQLSDDQAFVWGKGVKVDTPHIDSIARDGALCTSYYAASPVCTPSRASFISGLYPEATGSPKNDMPLNDGLITFAEILKRQGYSTSYVGKWHLDGHAKPGFAPRRKFGFDDNRYMFNRGHWKMFRETAKGPAIIGEYNAKKGTTKYNIEDATERSFATDFLTDRTLEIIKRDKTRPFCVMLSIPDPHGPNTVRAPYDTMYTDMVFKNPRTMDVDPETMPKWVSVVGKNSANKLNQKQMAQYFGMVKCIDDNVGKILKYLKSQGLDKNTIVVFTSDHGDLMGEHKKHNKGNPYEASARIPFMIRYPGKIKPGKLIDTAYTTTDFAPTILGIMAMEQIPGSHGKNASDDFLGSEKEVRDDRIVYITNAASRWVAAVNSRYKLVLSPSDDPWLFDLQKDPDELINFYNDPEYKQIAERFKAALIEQMKRYNEPALKNKNLVYETGAVVSSDPSEEKKQNTWDGTVLEPLDESASGYLIDSGNHSVNAMNSGPGKWSRAITVPEGSFEKNSTYELVMEWESKGLSGDAEFFANFVGNKNDKNKKQLKTWKGAAGENGVIKENLATGDYGKWSLRVGVKDAGHLVVKRIQIKKKPIR